MESIFENGYLKSEFINQSYRGIVGWPCECDERSDITLISIEGGKTFEKWGFSGVHQCSLGEDLRIKQFTPEDIPEGELVWIKWEGCEWYLTNFDKDILGYECWCDAKNTIPLGYDLVPHLIAETAEKSEELKDWASC